MRATIKFLKYDGEIYTIKSKLAKTAQCSVGTINNILKGITDPYKYDIEIIEGIEYHGVWWCEDGEVRKTNGKPVARYGRYKNLIRTSRLKGWHHPGITYIGIANVIIHLFMDDRFNPCDPEHKVNFINGPKDCSLDALEPQHKTKKLLDEVEEDDWWE